MNKNEVKKIEKINKKIMTLIKLSEEICSDMKLLPEELRKEYLIVVGIKGIGSGCVDCSNINCSNYHKGLFNLSVEGRRSSVLETIMSLTKVYLESK